MSEKEGKKGSGLFGSLKGALFEDDGPKSDDGGGDEAPAHEAPKAPAAPQYRPSPAVVTPAAHAGAGAADPKVRAVLEKAVHEAALPAYVAFQAVIANLTMIPDERTRIQAALGAIQPQGHDLAAVLKDVDECLEALDKKESEADQAAAKAIRDRVGSREDDVKTKSARIAALKQEIAGLEADITREQAEIATERSSIDATHQNFTATVSSYRSELQAMKQKISQHGKGA